MPFSFRPLADWPLVVVEPRRFADDRGWFAESWKESDFLPHGIGPFVQDNHSYSAQAGVLRGIHYQLPPHAQGKLVRCIRGRIWDVAIDLRRESATYGKHKAVELSAANGHMLWVPEGFGHAFCTLEPDTEVVYKVTRGYSPAQERSIVWNDPDLAISWPVQSPLLAAKDAKAPRLAQADVPASW